MEVGKNQKKMPQIRLPIAMPLVEGAPGNGGGVGAPGRGGAAAGDPTLLPHLGQNWEPSGIDSAQLGQVMVRCCSLN